VPLPEGQDIHKITKKEHRERERSKLNIFHDHHFPPTHFSVMEKGGKHERERERGNFLIKKRERENVENRKSNPINAKRQLPPCERSTLNRTDYMHVRT
jgi:hypothetical protein